MYDNGEIKSFNNIFDFIPKSIVAQDIGKNIGRFTFFIEKKIDGLTMEELIAISKLCRLSRLEIYQLADKQYLIQKHKRPKNSKIDPTGK